MKANFLRLVSSLIAAGLNLMLSTAPFVSVAWPSLATDRYVAVGSLTFCPAQGVHLRRQSRRGYFAYNRSAFQSQR